SRLVERSSVLVVHATWHDTRLAVWAEKPTSPTRASSRARVRPHPFAATGTELVGSVPVQHGEIAELTLLLPGTSTSPAASPEVGRTPSATKPKLRAWRVPALLVDADDALGLLA